jgi:hypothetical protein
LTVSESLIATTVPFLGAATAVEPLPFIMKNAPPPPPSSTTAATMMISIFLLDFFGASAAPSFSSAIVDPPVSRSWSW